MPVHLSLPTKEDKTISWPNDFKRCAHLNGPGDIPSFVAARNGRLPSCHFGDLSPDQSGSLRLPETGGVCSPRLSPLRGNLGPIRTTRQLGYRRSHGASHESRCLTATSAPPSKCAHFNGAGDSQKEPRHSEIWIQNLSVEWEANRPTFKTLE